MIDVRELTEEALHVWPLVTIEEALGTEAALVLPPGIRTRRFTVRLPRSIVAALHRLAEEEGETVEALVTRELHGYACANRERLAAAIPGFAEAIAGRSSKRASRIARLIVNVWEAFHAEARRARRRGDA
jgi:predicted transcriptional regulator